MNGKARSQRNRRVQTKRRPLPSRQKITAPRTGKEYFAMPRAFQEFWNLVVQVPGLMRSRGLSLKRSSKEFGLNPRTVLSLARSAFRRQPNGRYAAKATDRLLRVHPVPSKKGLREAVVRDSRESSLIGQYWSAVDRYLSTGDATALQKLSRKYVIDENGRRIRLITDIDQLSLLANAGVLSFESIYARVE
jgi:hypothetical protein